MVWLSLAGVTFIALLPLVNPVGALPLFASLTQGLTPRQRRSQATRTAVFVFAILVVTEYLGNGILQLFDLSLGMLQIAGGLIVANTAWKMATGVPRVSPHERRALRRRHGLAALRESTVAAVTEAASAVADAAHTTGAVLADLPQRVTHQHEDDAAGAAEQERAGPSAPEQEQGQAENAMAGGDQTDSSPDRATAAAPAGQPGQVPHPKQPDIAFTPMAMPLLAGPGSMGVVIGLVAHYHGVVDSVGIAIGIAGIALLALICLLAATPINRTVGAGGILAMQRIFGFITLGIAVALVSTGIATLFGLTLHGTSG